MPNEQYYRNLTGEVYGILNPPDELVMAYTKWKKAQSMANVKIKSVKSDADVFSWRSGKEIERMNTARSAVRARSWLLTQDLKCFKSRGKGEQALIRANIVKELRDVFGLDYVWMSKLLTELVGRPIKRSRLLYIYKH